MAASAGAQDLPPGPGDYGFRHDEYHARGIIDELQRKTGSFCCHGGECRASYVKLAERKVLVDGRWCPIGHRTHMRSDIVLPDHFALVCAGKSEPGPLNQCPPVFCIVLAPGS
jgi:hypothetical protein